MSGSTSSALDTLTLFDVSLYEMRSFGPWIVVTAIELGMNGVHSGRPLTICTVPERLGILHALTGHRVHIDNPCEIVGSILAFQIQPFVMW